MADKQLVAGIKTLLDVAPLYGSVIVHLVRRQDSQLDAPFALEWRDYHWCLVDNPAQFKSYTTDQLAQALAHEALHLVWQHPIRYATEQENPVAVKVGTDLAVNQYLIDSLGKLPDAVTLATILSDYQKLLPAQADSQLYIEALKPLLDPDQANGQHSSDSHDGWQTAAGQLQAAQAALDNLLRQAVDDAKKAGRGQVPSEVLALITAVQPVRRSWQAILKMALSTTPNQPVASRARFNRRQPYRLDLPGKITQQGQELWVFIDNSASIASTAVAEFLAYAQQIDRQANGKIHYYAFDSRVTAIPNIQRWQRHVGGGTAFQAIFDCLLKEKQRPQQTTVIIFTDGAGEKQIDDHHFKRVYWVLTSASQLSVQPIPGKVIQMGDD